MRKTQPDHVALTGVVAMFAITCLVVTAGLQAAVLQTSPATASSSAPPASALSDVQAAAQATPDAIFQSLDASNPWFPDRHFPALKTPEWVGEPGVECVVVLAIDDMRDTAKYEQYLRPILNRLKQIDGRAAVSIMTCSVQPEDAQLQSWLDEGLSIECHTFDHPCPLLHGRDFDRAKATYDRCVDLLSQIPGNQPVAFRTPCCDSLNTVSPRFYSEIFPRPTVAGNRLLIDSSVMNFFTSDDPSIPRELVLDENGQERFWKYRVTQLARGDVVHTNFVNYITNHPWPYLINNSCWQFPCVAPSDWSAQHLHGTNNPKTIEDWKAALDITVHHQGVFNLVFHPHGWVTAEQIVELIDHAVTQHGGKVKFLNFREAAQRLNTFVQARVASGGSPEAAYAELSHREFRRQNPGQRDLMGIPEATRKSLWAAAAADRLPPLYELRSDAPLHEPRGNAALRTDADKEPSVDTRIAVSRGAFIHQDEICWINEHTADRPNLIERASLRDLVATGNSGHVPSTRTLTPIGAAVVDITPEGPVRLTGYGNRMSESDGVAVRIHARAISIGEPVRGVGGAAKGDPDSGNTSRTDPVSGELAICITVDNCGVPAGITETVYQRVQARYGIARERFAISSTHTHSGPWLRDFAPNIFADIPDTHAARLAAYERELIEKLTSLVDDAVASRRPGSLSLGFGQLNFAVNRRVLSDGQWTGFGETEGPVDNRFSLLAAHDAHGRVIAVLANYACHATTETGSMNQISGDWPGIAADSIEASLAAAGHENAVALIAVGCGADANPTPRGTHELAWQHGRAVAEEVRRMLATPSANSMQPIDVDITCRMRRVELPLGPLPTREDWESQAGDTGVIGARARHFLKMLDEGHSIPTTVNDYPVQTWCFGPDLAMVFLGGEVVVDYSIRLNEMFDSSRLWLNAYSNDVPCYIASRRILREGGYEADSSMVYYRQPARLAPEAEDVLCDAVQKLLPHEFYSPALQEEFPAPKSPEASLACISVRPGLRVELVAAEPLIRDPVAFDWDIQGRLWVVEMGGYPEGPPSTDSTHPTDATHTPESNHVAPRDGDGNSSFKTATDERGGASTGRVRVLEDTNGDGQYDRATTFLDGLNFPTGISMWRNGILITAAPDVIYAEDTDGDLIADQQTVLFTGFAEGNQQHRVNGLRWGLDGWLYLANGDSGGEIAAVSTVPRPGTETAENSGSRPNMPVVADGTNKVSIRGRDVRIQPDRGALETVSGQTQFGRERDDFGNWFGNNNSNPIWQYVLEDACLKRNPHMSGTDGKAQVASVPGAAPVFPVSTTLARFNDFGAVNRFTSACSTSIYRDHYLGEQFYGNALTCEPVHNLVSRLVLEREGVTFRGQRASDEQASEFFASSDNWTRPVMVRTGPDGALYVADMYRQVIEHPEWIPPEYQRKLDLYAGNDRGRIYRIRPTAACCDGQPDSATRRPDLFVSQPGNELPVSMLIERLSAPNGWWRDTAQRLLLHRGEQLSTDESVLDQINRLWTTPAEADGASASEIQVRTAIRVQALHTAFCFARESDDAVTKLIDLCTAVLASQDAPPELRRAIGAELESFSAVRPEAVLPLWTSLAKDQDAAVRMQIMLSLGAVRTAPAARLLGQMFYDNFDQPWLRHAGITSLTPDTIDEVLRYATDRPPEQLNEHLLAVLLSQAAAMGRTEHMQEPLTKFLVSLAPDSSTLRLQTLRDMLASFEGTAAGEQLRSASKFQTSLSQAVATAAKIARDTNKDEQQRAAALRFAEAAIRLGGGGGPEFSEFLGLQSPLAVQLAAATIICERAVRPLSGAEAAAGASSSAGGRTPLDPLFERWGSLEPAIRSQVITICLRRESTTLQALRAVESGELALSDFNAAQRDDVSSHRSEQIRQLAESLFADSTASERETVVADWRAQIADLTPNIQSGRSVFEKRCSNCHRVQDLGKDIGADLTALKDRSTDALLTAVLDPNRAVESKYLVYVVLTQDGLQYSGMLKGETGGSLNLTGSDGKEMSIARSRIEELVASGRSLMPEGLEKELSPQDLMDVIGFLQSAGGTGKRFEGNHPQVISADPDGSLTLPASAAEIYGPTLVFEQTYSNLGWWASADDYAVWTVDVPRSGHWTVELDFACDNAAAGDVIKFSTGTRLLSARVPGTGSWNDYRTWTVGELDLHAGRRQITVTAPHPPRSALLDLRAIRLIPPSP